MTQNINVDLSKGEAWNDGMCLWLHSFFTSAFTLQPPYPWIVLNKTLGNPLRRSGRSGE
jgi:hypothetical protein